MESYKIKLLVSLELFSYIIEKKKPAQGLCENVTLIQFFTYEFV